MDVSPNELRRETVATLKEINRVIDSVKQEAASRGRRPEDFIDDRGSWVMAPLLLAKTQCLTTLTLLRGQ